MMPCFHRNSAGWLESMGIYFHGDYLNLAGSQVRVPTERHMGGKLKRSSIKNYKEPAPGVLRPGF